jgi:hypothetical protein
MFAASKQAISVLEVTKWERTTESGISTAIAMLPVSLQSRFIPYRRSNSLHDLHADDLADEPFQRPRPLSEVDSLVFTKNRGFNEALSSDSSVDGTQSPPLPPRSGRSSPRTASGIRWNYARQGIHLVDHCAGSGHPASDEEDGAFERKAYIDGLTYLLRGLPGDLQLYEADQVRSALPAALISTPNVAAHEGAMHAQARAARQRTILHRAVQTAVIYLIFFFHFMLPYLVLCFRFVVRLERKHKVSERLVGHGIALANAAGRRGVSLTGSICRINDGRVGRALSELAAWTVDGVARGISDGVGEGLVIVGARPSTVVAG